jgi:hypothetical protein
VNQALIISTVGEMDRFVSVGTIPFHDATLARDEAVTGTLYWRTSRLP